MSRLPSRSGSRVAHAVRVAAAATLLLAVIYVAVVVIFNAVATRRMLSQVDLRLSERLSSAGHLSAAQRLHPDEETDRDLDAAPVVLWRVDARGRTTALSSAAPPLTAAAWSRSEHATSTRLGATTFRLRSLRVDGGWLVAGQSLAEVTHVQRVLLAAEVVAGPFILGALFLGTLVVGLKASGPVEEARRRQLEFTADASHELRTPLSVIEAEVDLALGARRNLAEYREALERVRGESQRLRHIVEDLLWLARFDAEPSPPGDEPVDVAVVAEVCTERFEAVARSRNIDLSVRSEGDVQARISAPAEWIDRLAGVLVDNACRYAGSPGIVVVGIRGSGNRVTLSVEDSGPGIAAEDRARLFDRFYRATDAGTGAGLGLAIADSIVRSTGGRWRIADSSLGGALMEVSWHADGGVRKVRTTYRLRPEPRTRVAEQDGAQRSSDDARDQDPLVHADDPPAAARRSQPVLGAGHRRVEQMAEHVGGHAAGSDDASGAAQHEHP